MAATIGKVAAVFTASSSGLTAGARAAGASLGNLERDVNKLRSSMRLLNVISGAQLFGSIASAASNYARSLASMGQAQAEAIDSTSKMSARLGMTYGELAGLAHAGNLADVSMEAIGKAATKADIAFVKAAQGSKEAQAAFTGIGLSVDDLQGKSPAERFAMISDAIAALPTAAERSAAAVRLFGRAGAEMLPLFAGGAGAIREATEEAKRFGLALTSAQGQDVEAMNDSFTKVQSAISGVVQQVVAYLAPSVEAIATTFTDLVGSIGGANIGQTIGEGILAGARYMAGVADWMISGLGGVWKYVTEVGAFWGGIFDAASRAASLFAGVGQTLAGLFQGFFGGVTSLLGLVSKTAKEMGQDLLRRSGENFAGAGKSFAAAFASGPGGLSGGGPISAALDAALARSRASAGGVDEAKGTTIGVKDGVVAAAAVQSVKAVDSRSQEGIAEMFRLMRGEGDDAAERTARATERIADNTEDMGMDVQELDFAW